MITIPGKSIRKSCSHNIAFKSKPFVGSSSNNIPGFPNKACANNTFTLSDSFKSFINIKCCCVVIPKPCSKDELSASASYPPSSWNSASNSAALIPSSSLKSSFMYIASFSFWIS